MAIALALNNVQDARPALIMMDEPERALHSAAQVQVARTFARSLDDIELHDLFVVAEIVATHSPAFLSLPGVNLLHVARGTDKKVSLDAIDTTIGIEGLTAELGLTRPDALLTVRCFMFVEGEHDAAVIRALFGDTLRDRHVHLANMSGAANIQAHLTAQHLLAFSDARIRVVLDRLGETAGDHWESATAAFTDGDLDGARRELEKVSRLSGREAKWLYEAGLAALERGQLDRIDVVGLDEKDIINYLPVEQIVPGATSWRALSKEYFDTKPNVAFKDWLKKAKGARITASRLGEIAGTLTSLKDLPRIVEGL
jgi:predicted ATP-dependent endonuclease of OLD family